MSVSLVSSFLTGLVGLPLRFFSAGVIKSVVRHVNSRSHVGGFLANSSVDALFSFIDFFVFTVMLTCCGLIMLKVFLLNGDLCVT